jgi:transporter family protein
VVLFGERLSPVRWAGVALMLGSYLAFSIAGRTGKGRWRGERWILSAFAASLVGAVSSMYDKYLFNRLQLDALAVQAWYTIYMALFFALIVAVLWWPRRQGTTPFRWRWTIPCIGLALAASDTCYFVALRDPDALIALLTTIRRANVVVAFAAGALLFREADIRGKVLPLAGILAGLVLLAWQV